MKFLLRRILFFVLLETAATKGFKSALIFDAGVILAIEPLHPLYAADRSAVNSMEQANQICENLNNHFRIMLSSSFPDMVFFLELLEWKLPCDIHVLLSMIL